MEILCLHSLGSCMGITNTLLPGDLKWSIFYPRPEERVMGSHSLLAGNSPSQMKNAADEVLFLPDFIPTLFQDFRSQCPDQRSSQPWNITGKISLPSKEKKVIIELYGNGGRSRMTLISLDVVFVSVTSYSQLAAQITLLRGGPPQTFPH